MKYRVTFLTAAISIIMAVPALSAQFHELTLEKAIEAVQSHFSDKEALFYIIGDSHAEESNDSIWRFFVDLAPGCNWEHDCCIVEIPKTTVKNVPISKITEMRFPPNEHLFPVQKNNGMKIAVGETCLLSEPCVDKRTLTPAETEAAKHTFAVILSGGGNVNANYARYWNDCSFLYQTLVNRYGIPKDNIHVLISDGTSDRPDMNINISNPTYRSSPLDLDFDGLPDTRYAATKGELGIAFNNISNKISDNDHFFLFVIDHGGIDENGESYICLWENSVLYPSELKAQFDAFSEKSIFKSIVMAQCYSGGFIDKLKGDGIVITTATGKDERSAAMSDKPFDEFAYNWTCAMNRADEYKHPILSGTNEEGYVSMNDAYLYAKSKKTKTEENPRFVSMPITLGSLLSFHSRMKPDIFIRDNYNDTGTEPNNTTKKYWNSPDIWLSNVNAVRVPADFIPDSIAFINLRVHNRGLGYYTGDKWLKVYWTVSTATPCADDWLGRSGRIGGTVWSGRIEDVIAPSDSTILVLPWILKEDARKNVKQNGNINLLAFITDSPYTQIYDSYDVKDNKYIAHKNISYYAISGSGICYDISIKNNSNNQKRYSIMPICTNLQSHVLSDVAATMTLDSGLYESWKMGGFVCSSCDRSGLSVNLTKTNSVIDSLYIYARQEGTAKLRFTLGPNYRPNGELQNYDFIVKANDELVGGMTYKLYPGSRIKISTFKANVTDYILSLEDDNTNDFQSIIWYDKYGNNIGNGTSIFVVPDFDGTEFSVEALREDGYVEQASVSLKSDSKIKNVTLSDDKSVLNLEFDGVAPDNSRIAVSSLIGLAAMRLSCDVPCGATDLSIDISGMAAGYYVVSYYVNDVLVENVKFIK
ncbi:MAG: C13 family peptidase [Muribaculum sp.]|nr:C13 family peptidase [Muribaculum sp.]